KKAGCDPLWMLNHCHYTDGARNGKRPLCFSRYAEPGSHRYPVGFSGDTVISWESLAFQPYFTATASNIGFSMWSHDIDGFKSGIRDDELYTRWVQLGVFSPIFRLHSAPNSYISKEPWSWGDTAERVVSNFMRLRHRLIPYLYTMNVRNHEDGIPTIRPLYHTNVNEDGAYTAKNVYWFGSELIAAPITERQDETSYLAKTKVWLPNGIWVDFFSGHIYRGGRNFYTYRTIDEMPVFAKAGAIVPLAASHIGTENPNSIELNVFGGANGEFTLVEDNDGIKDALVTARTKYTFTYGENSVLHIDTPISECIPKTRSYTVKFIAFSKPSMLTVGGNPLEFTYDSRTNTAVSAPFTVLQGESSVITVTTDGVLPQNEVQENALKILRRTRTMPALTLSALHSAVCKDAPASVRIAEIHDTAANEHLKGALIELVTEF
ncbi:MAG: alpha-xylosidase, partial [Clostridia bacterium]|nr:alpha-xylosidase [Clostridia bacterium]